MPQVSSSPPQVVEPDMTGVLVVEKCSRTGSLRTSIMAGLNPESPAQLGIILADVVRHARMAFQWSVPQMGVVLKYFRAEMKKPTSEISTIQSH